MTLHNMMFNGISGLNSMSSSMAVLGNNIANINSTSYKSAQITFQNVLTSSQGRFGEVGNGSQVESISKNFRPGQLEATSNSTDMAISGRGFFMVNDPQVGEILYTRDGQFDLKAMATTPEGFYHLVTPAGYFVQGLDLDSGRESANAAALGDILVRRQSLPKATESVTLALNLQHNSEAAGLNGDPAMGLSALWDGTKNPPLAADAYEYQTKLRAYDDRGQPFDLYVYFKQGHDPQVQEFILGHDPALDRRLIGEDGSRYGDGPDQAGAGALLYGKLLFNSSGELVDIQAWQIPPDGVLNPGPDNMLEPDAVSGLYSFAYNLSGEGGNLRSTIDFGKSVPGLGGKLSPIRTTNYAVESSTLFQLQDGYSKGFLQTISVRPDGTVLGSYSNGQSHAQGQVLLADFTNYRGLIPGSHNTYRPTDEAGEKMIGAAGSGSFGKVLGNSLEVSNVDLGRQFVDLMMTQRIFQANSKSITTADEIFNTLIRLK